MSYRKRALDYVFAAASGTPEDAAKDIEMLRVAIEEEKSAIRSYMEKAIRTNDARLREFFKELRRDEEEHYGKLIQWVESKELLLTKTSANQQSLLGIGSEVPIQGVGDPDMASAPDVCPQCGCSTCSCAKGDFDHCNCGHNCSPDAKEEIGRSVADFDPSSSNWTDKPHDAYNY